MGVFNALEFDGINSLDYGVYITGEAVFNSPQRSVEAVTVPGRNGDVLLDLGRYENIEVTYHAGVFGADQSEFATKIRTFRNLLASRVGYKRITDTYNPNEYRMGTFIASVDVTPTSMDRHGEFDIVFNCKPQRFLTSGETAITVADGDTVTNPTLFDAQPLLAIEGYGTIGFNGYEVELADTTLGIITLLRETTNYFVTSDPTQVFTSTFNRELVRAGDTFTLSNSNNTSVQASGYFAFDSATYSENHAGVSYTYSNIEWSEERVSGGSKLYVRAGLTSASFVAGTASTHSGSITFTIPLNYASSGSATGQSVKLTLDISIAYDGDNKLTFTITRTVTSDPLSAITGIDTTTPRGQMTQAEVVADSTASLLGQPTYIDCELGEAYKVEDGEFISLNEYIDLGSDLPTLAPGNNEFSFDDTTMTDVKLTPRYWIL